MVSFFLAFNIANAFLHKRRSEQTILKEQAARGRDSRHSNFKESLEKLWDIIYPNEQQINCSLYEFDDLGWVPCRGLNSNEMRRTLLSHVNPMCNRVDQFKFQVQSIRIPADSAGRMLQEKREEIEREWGLKIPLEKKDSSDGDTDGDLRHYTSSRNMHVDVIPADATDGDLRHYKQMLLNFLLAVREVVIDFKHIMDYPQDIEDAQMQRKATRDLKNFVNFPRQMAHATGSAGRSLTDFIFNRTWHKECDIDEVD
jgi:hypothetical protein